MRIADAVDAAMEATVVPSFTRLGPVVRSRLEHWSPPTGRLAGRVIVITGATSGLGLAAARAWSAAGATIELIARNPAKAEATAHTLRRATPDAEVGITIADTGDLAAMRAAAATLRGRHARIDALVHNAGALDPTHAYASGGI
ncbi:MAG: SDR family NAD(P)-dependent oxidoreductase, partial [Actinomycetota bacterium]